MATRYTCTVNLTVGCNNAVFSDEDDSQSSGAEEAKDHAVSLPYCRYSSMMAAVFALLLV